MAFVKEILTKEELEKNKIENDNCWYIDKDRDAIFYYNYGNPRGREKIFRLIWKSKNIEVAALQHSFGNSKETLSDEWREVFFMYEGAKSLEEGWIEEERENIAKIIIDALTAFSTGFLTNTKTKIIFDKKMFIDKSELGHGNTRSH